MEFPIVPHTNSVQYVYIFVIPKTSSKLYFVFECVFIIKGTKLIAFSPSKEQGKDENKKIKSEKFI